MRYRIQILLLFLFASTWMACEKEKDNSIDITQDVATLNKSFESLQSKYEGLADSIKKALDNKEVYTRTASFKEQLDTLEEALYEVKNNVQKIDQKAGNNYTASNLDLYERLKEDMTTMEVNLDQLRDEIKTIDENNRLINGNQHEADEYLEYATKEYIKVQELLATYSHYKSDIEAGQMKDVADFVAFGKLFPRQFENILYYKEKADSIASLFGVSAETSEEISQLANSINELNIPSKNDILELEVKLMQHATAEITLFNDSADVALTAYTQFDSLVNEGMHADDTELNKAYDFLCAAKNRQDYWVQLYKELSNIDALIDFLFEYNRLSACQFPSAEEIDALIAKNPQAISLSELISKDIAEVENKILQITQHEQLVLNANELAPMATKLNALKDIQLEGGLSFTLSAKINNGTIQLSTLNQLVDTFAANQLVFINDPNNRTSNVEIDTKGKTDLSLQDLRFWGLNDEERLLIYASTFIFKDPNVRFKDEVVVDLEGKDRKSFPLKNIYVNFGYELKSKNYKINRIYSLPKGETLQSLQGEKILFPPTYFKFDKNTVIFKDIQENNNSVNFVQVASDARWGNDEFTLENIVELMQNSSIGEILMEKSDVAIVLGTVNADCAGDFFIKYAGEEKNYEFDADVLDVVRRVSAGNNMENIVGAFSTKNSDPKKLTTVKTSSYMKLRDAFGDENVYTSFANTIVKEESESEMSGLRNRDAGLGGVVIYEGDMPAGSRILPETMRIKTPSGDDVFFQRDPSIVNLGWAGEVSHNSSSEETVYYLDNNPNSNPNYGSTVNLNDNMNSAGNETYADIKIGGETKRIFFKKENGAWVVDKSKTDSNVFAMNEVEQNSDKEIYKKSFYDQQIAMNISEEKESDVSVTKKSFVSANKEIGRKVKDENNNRNREILNSFNQKTKV